jgi:two-component system cell cycle sensor histidine kinase/response regulator CckA
VRYSGWRERPLGPPPAPPRLGHDLSNQLSIVLGFSELLLAGMRADDPLRPDLLEIEKAARAAMQLVSQFLLHPQ